MAKKLNKSLEDLNITHENGDEKVFENKLKLAAEEAVSLDKSYILGITGTQCSSEFRLAAALSDFSCVAYDVGETLRKIATLKHSEAPIVGVRYSPTNSNLIYCASSDGYITLWDLRAAGEIAAQFKDDTEIRGKLKPLASFDIGYEERLLAGGTELVGVDAFILFWDTRYNSKTSTQNKPLGGYWESHTDDITTVEFHPTKRAVLASGSTDGLINVFDLTQPTEDSALMQSLNTESSVDRLGWLDDESLWCSTHTHCLQLWDCQGAAPDAKFDRQSLLTSENEDLDNCYLVRMHANYRTKKHFLLAGSSNEIGENLRCMGIAENELKSWGDLPGNKQIVRDSWFHEKTGCLVSGGERGIISVWRDEETLSIGRGLGHKSDNKITNAHNRNKLHIVKPY